MFTIVSGLLFYGVTLVAEKLTITSYYPSPYGVYKQFRATGTALLATNSGYVGIGTTGVSPAATLTIFDDGNDTGISLVNPTTTADATQGITFHNGLPLDDSTKQFQMFHCGPTNGGCHNPDDIAIMAVNGRNLVFETDTDNSTPPIAGSVRFKKGATSDGACFDGSNGNFEIGSYNCASASNAKLAVKNTDSAQSAMRVTNSGNTNVLEVADNGNIGIGSATPLAKLDVAGDILASGKIQGVKVIAKGYVSFPNDGQPCSQSFNYDTAWPGANTRVCLTSLDMDGGQYGEHGPFNAALTARSGQPMAL
ncbi:hypothetical protein ACFL6Y_03470 [Elusimicrobiota bacterium]